MADRSYLNKVGLVDLITKISELIKSHTSSTLDPNKPNNFTTVQAVNNALTDRSKLKITLQETTSDDNGYVVSDNVIEYNGTEAKVLDLKLATVSDIDSLFNT